MATNTPAASDRFTVELNHNELVLVNNALNEVCHGVDIEDTEFSTRLGGSRQEAQALLLRFGRLLDEATRNLNP
jgi:hypothetical protein